MSKQSEAKAAQDYQPKPLQKMCSNCLFFDSEIITEKTRWGEYSKEKNMRCSIGGFAVKKMGLCSSHQLDLERV